MAQMISRTGFAGDPAPNGRQAWRAFLDTALSFAVAEQRGMPISEADTEAFGRMVERLKAPFPVRVMSAQLVASACLDLARAAALTAMPEDREAVGGLLLAAANFLDGVLHADACERAALSRRITGESED